MTENHFTSKGKFIPKAYDESISNFPEYEMDSEEFKIKNQLARKANSQKNENEENAKISSKANTNKSLISVISKEQLKENKFPSVKKFKLEEEEESKAAIEGSREEVENDNDDYGMEMLFEKVSQARETSNNSNINEIKINCKNNNNNDNFKNNFSPNADYNNNNNNNDNNKKNSIIIESENEKDESSTKSQNNSNSASNQNRTENEIKKTENETQKTDSASIYTKRLDIHDFIQASQNMISDYICELCKGVYWDPHVDGCGHVYCKECFYKFIAQSEKNLCPTSGLEIDLSLVAPIKFVAAILEKQTLRCAHQNCDWLGKLLELQPHLDVECLFEPVFCSFEKCRSGKILRKNKNEHEETCDFRPSQCDKCFVKMFLGEKNSHKKICGKELIACLQNCGEMVERECAAAHVAAECGFSLVQCQYHEFGCEAEIMKKDLKAHLIEEVNFHNLCVCRFLNKFKLNLVTRVESIENKLQQNNDKFDDIYGFLETDFRKINEMIMKGSNNNNNKGYSCSSNNNNANNAGSKVSSKTENVAKVTDDNLNRVFNNFNANKNDGVGKEAGKTLLGKKKNRGKEKGFGNEENRGKNAKKKKEDKIMTDDEVNENDATESWLDQQPQSDFLFEIPTDGISVSEKNKNSFIVTSEKKKHKFLLMQNTIEQNSDFSFTVKIKRLTGFMAFGLCEKQRLQQNEFKFNGISNKPHGCFLVSSNKYLWNNNLLTQNNLFVEKLPNLQSNDKLEFSYDSAANLLRFRLNNGQYEGALKRVFTEIPKVLVPCFVMIDKDDEILIEA